jgi:hypothetical protein
VRFSHVRGASAAVAAFAALFASGCSGPRATSESARGASEAWTRVDVPLVLDQDVHSAFACGPAALATAFAASGGAARRTIAEQGDGVIAWSIERFGTRPSPTYEGAQRFDPDSGICAEDLIVWSNEWSLEIGAPPRVGVYLDRVPEEPAADFAARVHALLAESLARGVAPVVRLRSFVPSYDPQRGAYLWTGVVGHWVTLVGVPSDLPAGALGFPLEYADPASGAVASGYVHVDDVRPFVAAKGHVRAWEWLDDSPFLVAHLPEQRTLGLTAQPWFLRTVVTLDHALVAAPIE